MKNTPKQQINNNHNRGEIMKRAYGLSRVSTINQEHNTSIDHQREKISQYSNLNNFNNSIQVYNNVYISLLDGSNSFIKTSSLNWNLNTANIIFNNPIHINLNNSSIHSTDGSYNTKSNLLKINNNVFNRTIYNSEGEKKYTIEIKSDNAKWFKNKELLEFTSKDSQVETTINFLTSK